MRKIWNIILGIWCWLTWVVSPVWLLFTVLNLTGLIYTYDGSMDEGTAIIIGIALLVLWILFVFIPNYIFIKRVCIHQILNAVMFTFTGVFVGYGIYEYWHYRTYPKLYAMQSAPWYTGILLDGAVTLILLALCFLLKLLVKKKMQK